MAPPAFKISPSRIVLIRALKQIMLNLFNSYKKNHLPVAFHPLKGNGADTENRTRDLTLTKGALYQLSHISTQK